MSAPIPAGALVTVEASGVPVHEAGAPREGFRVLVPEPPWHRGELKAASARSLDYTVTARRDGLAELRVGGAALTESVVCRALAKAGMIVVADVRRGGVLVPGCVRIAAIDVASPCPGPASADEADEEGTQTGTDEADREVGWWPDEPPFAGTALARWSVSRATARIVRGGHPWLLPDRDTEPVDRWRPGTLVEAVAPGGAPLGLARIEGPGPIAARVWARADAARGAGAASVGERVAAALARRAKMASRGPAQPARDAQPWTDALRLVHGEADALPGIAVDRLGPILRILVTSYASALSLVDPVAEALRASGDAITGPVAGIVIVLHFGRDTPGRPECVRWWNAPGAAAPDGLLDERGRLVVHERGLRFRVDPGLAQPERPRPGVGLFLDQRENRQRLARSARRGGRWLNLFAHTGAFSVSLLAAGAEEVVSVDLSKPYLEWLDENLALNAAAGVERGRHHGIRRDGRRHLEAMPSDERFAGIVLDPPTAAAAGRKYWSTQRDLQPLVGAALARLAPGGVLLASHNHRRARGELSDLVAAAAAGQGIGLDRIDDAGPGPDFPRLRGFREGDSFRGVIAVRR